MEADSQVQQALERSKRVGELLLKNEQEELQSIAKYADDLIRSEYRYLLELQMLSSYQRHASKAFILFQAPLRFLLIKVSQLWPDLPSSVSDQSK